MYMYIWSEDGDHGDGRHRKHTPDGDLSWSWE